MKEFTSQQREVIARKLGYDGPMAGFDEFIESSPALKMKYAAISDKYTERMARGGLTRRVNYADGGTTTASVSASDISAYVTSVYNDPNKTPAEKARMINDAAAQFNVTRDQIASAINVPIGEVNAYLDQSTPPPPPPPPPAPAPAPTPESSVVDYGDRGRPVLTAAPPTADVATVEKTGAQQISTDTRAAPAQTAAVTQAAPASQATATPVPAAAEYQAVQSAQAVSQALSGVEAAQGTVTREVEAATKEPTSTALMGMEAAEGVAREVQGAPTRVVETGELVSGTAVDQAKVREVTAQAEAAQGAVTSEMTVQGQLNKLMENFEAGNPPPWAAANLRAVSAQLAARGLGASSLAGQALIQATLESALPVASADAAAYQAMAAQNLSNRQQTAMLVAQQRAQFLGQEFDQAFQTRVLNAAKISDIANMNFSAQQQIAIENARLAQTMDLANLSNDQAMVMAKASQIATLEVTNLNNRQQAAVENARAFLAMDMANLSNRQQATLFKAQQITQALLTDTASQNAARQFNAASTNQINQFNAGLVTQVSQFNAAQTNAINQFNTEQANVLARFNTEQQNLREQFNAQQRLIIDQANAQWEREIATVNTAATNASNLQAAQIASNMTITEYNNEVQLYRDAVNQAWQSGENDAQRAATLAGAEISSNAAITAATISASADIREAEIQAASRINVAEAQEDAKESEAWGKLLVKGLEYAFKL